MIVEFEIQIRDQEGLRGKLGEKWLISWHI